MGSFIHAKRYYSGQLKFRVWSPYFNTYASKPLDEELMRRFELYRAGVNCFRDLRKEIDLDIEMAKQHGTSEVVTVDRSFDRWERVNEPTIKIDLPTKERVEVDFPHLSDAHKVALAALPPEVAYVAAMMLEALETK